MSGPETLVTGGTGVLCRRVVERLRAAGVEARVLSRSGRPGTVRGVDTVIHGASSPFGKFRQVDVDGTGRLLEAAAGAGVSHVVYISIVGVDRVSSYPYYRIKLETERAVEASPVPHTILRATQFYDLVLMAIQALERLPASIGGKRGLPAEKTSSLYEQMLAFGFIRLGEEADRGVVCGGVGQMFRLRGGVAPAVRDTRSFLAFEEPGYARVAMNFSVATAGARLATETRVVITDPASRRRFGRYWRVIRPGSAAIRRSWLRAAKRRAEGDAGVRPGLIPARTRGHAGRATS